MPLVSDILRALDAWAPQGQKADFDRVGLQVGDPRAEAARVLTALDLTPAVIEEAVETGAAMIVTHHPLLFQPAARVTADAPVGALVLRLASAGIAYAAVHTNLDAAWDGVSFALAAQLGLAAPRLLAPLDGVMRTVVTFVPETHAAAVRRAMAEAGAGAIDAYTGCSFSTDGTGRFTPSADASPAIGTAGGDEEAVAEQRVEAAVPSWAVDAVVRAICAAHPYESPSIDIYAVQQAATRQGYGVVGRLDVPEALPDFLARVATRLGAGALRYVGRDDAEIRTVAVCGGSGMSFLGAALRAGADAYVTADITYHRFFEALAPDGAPRLALIDAGHYETEAITEHLLADHLRATVEGLETVVTRTRTSPMRTFVPTSAQADAG